MNSIVIISNLDEDEAIEFINLLYTGMKRAAKEGGSMEGVFDELRYIAECDSRKTIKDLCTGLQQVP